MSACLFFFPNHESKIGRALEIVGPSTLATVTGIHFVNGAAPSMLSGSAALRKSSRNLPRRKKKSHRIGVAVLMIDLQTGELELRPISKDRSVKENAVKREVSPPDAHGGCIFVTDGAIAIFTSIIISQGRAHRGGAIGLLNSGNVNITNSILTQNSATSIGTGVFVAGGAAYACNAMYLFEQRGDPPFVFLPLIPPPSSSD